jgi:hypothetical protein
VLLRADATLGSEAVACVSRGKLLREKDSVGFWWVRTATSMLYLALAVKNMGRTGPIPPPTPLEYPWTVLFVGSLLWALVSVLVATESANAGMRRRAWGWAATFLCASLAAAYSFGRLV